ncbi:MAG: TetR/AcrR family transcriptional regulator [Brevundimonas sp.]|uniref:TetR/AcrR family transcriptional regulator n=1 Tax=Brevundimonas sp. TaxID=1871086 RepID=UPI0028D7CAF0|nr:helix-turn-helix domain-containing protein [uncultured Brevundimonas sp.]
MTQDEAHHGDGRRRRTRQAITEALIRLMSDRRYSAIRTADLVQAAGVGRSTLYEHFQSKEAVLDAVVEPILMPLALAGAGLGNTARLKVMLDHLWERRALTRHLFEAPLQTRLQRRLAGMIEAKLAIRSDDIGPVSLVARGAAARQLAMLQMWLSGETACHPNDLANTLVGVRRRSHP